MVPKHQPDILRPVFQDHPNNDDLPWASRHLHPIDGNVLYGPLRFRGRDLCFFFGGNPGYFGGKRLRFSEKPGFSSIFGCFMEKFSLCEMIYIWYIYIYVYIWYIYIYHIDIYIYDIWGLFQKQNTTIHGDIFYVGMFHGDRMGVPRDLKVSTEWTTVMLNC